MPEPFILLDDARTEGASAARLYRAPSEVVIARRPDEVAPALARIEALRRDGAALAGWLAYEAGLALEPRLAGLATKRTGAAGPLVWFGAFAGWETIPAAQVPAWLEREAGPARPGSVRSTRSCRRAAMPAPLPPCARQSSRATSTRPI